MTTADHEVTKIEQNWSDEDIKVMEGMQKAKEVSINSGNGEEGTGEEGEEEGGAEGTTTKTTKKKDANASADQLQGEEGAEGEEDGVERE